MNHTIIRGLILYRIQIICSQARTIAIKKHNTKIQDEKVHIISINLLLPWYIIVRSIVSDNIIEIMSINRFARCKLNIFKILKIK